MNRTPRGQKPQVEHPFALLARLMHYVFRDYKFHCIAVFLLIFAGVIANVQGTMFTKNLIDDYITPFLLSDNPNFAPLAKAISRVAVFYAIGVISTYTYNRIMVSVTQGTLRNLRNDLFAHMEKLPIRYFDTHSHGDIMSVYTNDIDTLRQMISQSIPQIINSTFTIVSVFVSMLILNIPLTLVTLVMVSLMLICTKKAAGQSGKYFLDQQKNLGAVNGYIEEMMNGQKVVKVFCHEDASIREFHELNEALYTSADRANTFANILGPINAQLGNISYVICAIVGGVLALNGFGGFTLGGLASFLTFNKSFNMPINQVSQQFNAIVMAMAGADRIFRLMDEPVEKDDGYVLLVNAKEENGKLTESTARTGQWAWKHTHQADGSVDYKKLRGDVVFDGVDFGYTDDKIVLHDVKLYAKPGQKIAFVGSTGAGKTTITNLINRFYDIQDGKIRYDGIDIRDIRKAGPAPVPRQWFCRTPHLFTGTVARKHPLRKAGCHRRGGPPQRQGYRQCGRLSSAVFPGRALTRCSTGDGSKPVPGAAAAPGDCPGGGFAGPPVLILDEGDQLHRYPDGTHRTGRHGPAHEGPHDLRHRLLSLHGTEIPTVSWCSTVAPSSSAARMSS